jgi:hypothetical protein
LAASGPDAVAALGPGVSQFWSANPTTTSLFELNPISSATWQPGQSWSIGFPFSSDDPNFLLDAELVISSPDGLLLTNGTVVFSPEQALASLVVVPEPSSHGDFNNDGTVDTADYVVWRKGLGTTYDQSDYGVWRAHFGASLVLSSGSIDPQSLWSASVELLPAVPEPKTLITLLIGFLLMQWRLRRVTT